VLDEVVTNATPWPLYPRKRDPVHIVEEAGWVQVPVWTGVEYLATTGIRSPDLTARSGLCYLGVQLKGGEMGRVCGTHGGREGMYKLFGR
jgi:hypothetical protein